MSNANFDSNYSELAREITDNNPEYSVSFPNANDPMYIFPPENHELDKGFSVVYSESKVTITNLEYKAKFTFDSDVRPDLIANSIMAFFYMGDGSTEVLEVV